MYCASLGVEKVLSSLVKTAKKLAANVWHRALALLSHAREGVMAQRQSNRRCQVWQPHCKHTTQSRVNAAGEM